MAAEGVIAKVVAAVNLAYTGEAHNRQARKDADNWLCEFRRQPEAWAVAGELLAQPDAGHILHFFAAQTLHTKLRHDFKELPEDQVLGLKQTLLAHLMKALASSDKPVVNKLRLALAAIAVQTNWHGFADDILSGAAAIAPDAGPGAAEMALLFVVEVIPDECRSERLNVPAPQRRAFLEALDGMAVKVFEFIARLSTSGDGATVQRLVNPMLRCLRAWVEHCAVPPTALVQSPLFYATFQALNGESGFEESFEEACDAAVGIMRKYDAAAPANAPVVQEMVPRIMALAPRLRVAKETDPDEFRGFVVLFTEMGEAFLDFLLSDRDVGQQAVFELLLECTSCDDPEVARIPLQFWYRMRMRISEFDHMTQDALMSAFGPVYKQLLRILLPLGRHSSDYNVDSFEVMREYVADALDDCCMMIGAQDVLDDICRALSGAMGLLLGLSPARQLEEWQATESCLFAITCIRNRISVRDSAVFGDLIFALPQLPPVDALRTSSYRIIGYFAAVFRSRGDLLEPCFQFLLAGLGNKGTSHDASHAIRDVCETNFRQLGEPVLGLFDSLGGAHLDSVDENAILQGLSAILCNLPVPRCDQFLQHMLAPSMANLALAAEGKGGADVAKELDKIAVFMKYTRPLEEHVEGLAPEHHPVVLALQRLWPVLAAVLARYPNKSSIVERACRIIKHAIRSAKRHITTDTLRFVTDEMVRFFDAAPQSAFLYVTSICVADYSGGERAAENAQIFCGALVRLSQRVSTILNTEASFDQHPDIVEEYSYLIARYLEVLPSVLAQSGFVPSVLAFAGQAMRVTQREAHTGVLFSLTIFLMLGVPPRDDKRPGGVGLKSNPLLRLSPEEQRMVIGTVQQALAEHGAALVAMLVRVLTSGMPFIGYEGERASPGTVIYGLLQCVPEAFQAWLMESLGSVPTQINENEDKQEFMVQLSKARGARDCTDAAYRLWRRAQNGHRRQAFQAGVGGGPG